MRIAHIHKRGQIFATTQALYDRKHKDRTAKVIAYINKILPDALKLVGVTRHVNVIVKYYKGNTLGSYSSIENALGIDPRWSIAQIVDTLLHELTHARQYHTNKLQNAFNVETMRWEYVWNGENFGKGYNGANSSQWDKYRHQPWEVEARAVAAELSGKILEKHIF
jgi:hypothetical protein